MICFGKDAVDHPLQGITKNHMLAFAAVAINRKEIIMVRPVSIWAKSLIEAGYPTKGFHVKAKSSNWGPQCGLIVAVPELAWLSKTGKGAKEKKNKEYIEKAIGERQKTVALYLSEDRIRELYNTKYPSTKRTPIFQIKQKGQHLVLTGICPNAGPREKKVDFWAFYTGTDKGKKNYKVHVILKVDTIGGGKYLEGHGFVHPIWVFSGPTEDGEQKPLVADYDLLGVCPRWADWDPKKDIPIIPVAIKGKSKGDCIEYFEKLQHQRDERIIKEIIPKSTRGNVAQKYLAHLNLPNRESNLKEKHQTRKQITFKKDKKLAGSEVRRYEEHPDYGNWSVRVRDCVLDLNKEMGYTGRRACLKTVHHSADLLSPFVQEGEDYVPTTIFLPKTSISRNLFEIEKEISKGVALGRKDPETTIILIERKEGLEFFLVYLTEKGYYVPLNAGHEEHKGMKGMKQEWGPKGFSKEFQKKLEENLLKKRKR